MTFMRANSHMLSGSIRLAAPPVKVWELITAIARITEWYDGWDAVEHASDEERLQVGASFRLIRHRIGDDDTALCHVTWFEPPRRLRWLQQAPQLPLMAVEFQLLPDSEGVSGTWLNHTRSWIEPRQPLS